MNGLGLNNGGVTKRGVGIRYYLVKAEEPRSNTFQKLDADSQIRSGALSSWLEASAGAERKEVKKKSLSNKVIALTFK